MPQSENIPPSRFGLPVNSKFCLVLGRLFKLHPSFDEILFRILQSTPDNVYILFVREKNSALNDLLYRRWEEYQEKLCCEEEQSQREINHGTVLPTCCGNMNLYQRLYQYRHLDMTEVDSKVNIRGKRSNSLDNSCEGDSMFCKKMMSNVVTGNQTFVMHRLRFIHYSSYLDAVLSAHVVLDTYPYGGNGRAYTVVLVIQLSHCACISGFHEMLISLAIGSYSGCLTSHDAMSNGVPMVTLPSQFARYFNHNE